MKKLFLWLFINIISVYGFAQETFPTNGAKDNSTTIYAFTEVLIYKDYQTKIENAILLVQNGKVLKVGKDISIPNGAIKINLKGKTIYPSFIDLYSNYGLPVVKKTKRSNSPIYTSTYSGPFHWNEAIHPEYNSFSEFRKDDKSAEELRKMGFGTVLTHSQNGIARGTGSLVLLGNENENHLLLENQATAHYSFEKGLSQLNYPSSQMGSIALLRQSFYDADWYTKSNSKTEINLSLESLHNCASLPQIFEVKTN